MIKTQTLCLQPPVLCNGLCVMCHVSHVTIYFFWDKVVKLVGGGSVINRTTPFSYYIDNAFFVEVKQL